MGTRQLFQDLPLYDSGAGIQTQFGIMVPPGGKCIYLRSTGIVNGDSNEVKRRLVKTLAQALKDCRSGKGDTIFVLPGHAETITDNTMLTNMVASTHIVGVGDPRRSDAPTFTWGAPAASWAISVANCDFSNLRLLCDGFNGVTNAINITAAGTTFSNCYISGSRSSVLQATTCMTIGSGALTTRVKNCYFAGVALGAQTDVIILLGATLPSYTEITDNVITGAVGTTEGVVNVSVAALGVIIARNWCANLTASSAAVLQFGAVASTGFCIGNYMLALSTGTVTSGTTGITCASGNLTGFFDNKCVNDVLKSAILIPTADT